MPAPSDAALVAAIAVAITVADRFTKSMVISAIGPDTAESRVAIAGNWLALEYSENRGAAFGLFPGLAPLLAFASLSIVAGLVVQYWRQPSPSLMTTIGVGAISGGAIGNMIDRVHRGYVVDFVSIGSWPNFNVADCAVSIGVIALLWTWMRPQPPAFKSVSG